MFQGRVAREERGGFKCCCLRQDPVSRASWSLSACTWARGGTMKSMKPSPLQEYISKATRTLATELVSSLAFCGKERAPSVCSLRQGEGPWRAGASLGLTLPTSVSGNSHLRNLE